MNTKTRVLLVKLSSLGDIIHTLYALKEASIQAPHVHFDWLIESEYVPLVESLPNVRPLSVRLRANRRLRLGFLQSLSELITLRRTLRKTPPDLVIDAQGLMKSATLASLLGKRVPRHGFHHSHAREPLAALLYTHKHHLSVSMDAILRTRTLFAQSLGYELLPNERLKAPLSHLRTSSPAENVELPSRPFVFLAHGSAWPSKQYAEEDYRALLPRLHSKGFDILLTAQGDAERARAKNILQGEDSRARLLPPMSLTALIPLLARASLLIGSDTGLLHLAEALGVPSIALFGPTSPLRTGLACGLNLFANYPCAPCFKRRCLLKLYPSPCLKALHPETLLEAAENLLSPSQKEPS